VMLGVGIGIVAMRFAAGIFSYAVQREPVLHSAAYILILNIGVQLILEQVWQVEISDLTRFAISVAIIFIALAYAHSPFLQKFRFILYGLSFCFGVVNKLMDWLLLPFKVLFHWAFNGFRLSKAETTK